MTAVVSKLVDGYMVNVHTADSPSDEEWQHVLGLANGDLKGTLVWTAGGAPTYSQRQAFIKVAQSASDAPSAFLTQSTLTRTIIKAASLVIGHPMKVFELGQLEEALNWLGVPPESRPGLISALAEGRQQLGL